MSKEILKKVRQIEIRTKNVVNDFFGGDYHSNFKGRGMTFSEVREYVPGDDVRSIDWNVTARTGKPHIKIFEEERELSVLILIDVSSSGVFGSKKDLKIDLGVEIAAMLSFSAIKNNDKVGLALFSDKVEKYIPPKKGKKHVITDPVVAHEALKTLEKLWNDDSAKEAMEVTTNKEHFIFEFETNGAMKAKLALEQALKSLDEHCNEFMAGITANA